MLYLLATFLFFVFCSNKQLFFYTQTKGESSKVTEEIWKVSLVHHTCQAFYFLQTHRHAPAWLIGCAFYSSMVLSKYLQNQAHTKGPILSKRERYVARDWMELLTTILSKLVLFSLPFLVTVTWFYLVTGSLFCHWR